MAVQKTILHRVGFDAAGNPSGATGTLATGIPGERCDTAPIVEHTYLAASATRYGWFADDGLVVNPKEGVRFGGSIADGLAVAAGTNVAVATKGHFFAALALTAKTVIAKGAAVYANATTGVPELAGASESRPVRARVLEAVAYTPASGSGASAVAEQGAEQFRVIEVEGTSKYEVVVKIELV